MRVEIVLPPSPKRLPTELPILAEATIVFVTPRRVQTRKTSWIATVTCPHARLEVLHMNLTCHCSPPESTLVTSTHHRLRAPSVGAAVSGHRL
ncbi:hypothetical protein DY000_02014860 [Brassica cretica]|uniref:Uncharacterized protein n=1 Tax=Brassica cretica TaxID=69181 RepID=A0ABQ7D1N3_BRACR|nr:hypothetical protein DY000_02014860 [Brassica cretica]